LGRLPADFRSAVGVIVATRHAQCFPFVRMSGENCEQSSRVPLRDRIVGQRLPVGLSDDIAAGHGVPLARATEAAGCHRGRRAGCGMASTLPTSPAAFLELIRPVAVRRHGHRVAYGAPRPSVTSAMSLSNGHSRLDSVISCCGTPALRQTGTLDWIPVISCCGTLAPAPMYLAGSSAIAGFSRLTESYSPTRPSGDPGVGDRFSSATAL
jgi:hypothetical protein